MDEFAVAVGRTFPWHEVVTPNVEATVDFYTKALGWETETMQMGEGPYTMLKANGTSVCGVFDSAQAGGAPPHWAVYIAVDDLDHRLAKCTEHGATIVVPAMHIATVGRMALIADPHGAHVWLYESETKG
jgi:predicted enzyme related to lactoylglutathione lyase